MTQRKKSIKNLGNINFQKAIDELIKKRFDVEMDQFLKKYVNNFLRDFENQQKRNLTNNLVDSLFSGTENNSFSGRGMSERQLMSGIFSGFLKSIF